MSLNSSSNLMPVLGGIILLGVCGYFLFFAADGYGLSPVITTVIVRAKEYRPTRTGYVTDIIAGKAKPVPRVYPEEYVLKFELLGTSAEGTVSRDDYQTIETGDPVVVTYQKRRVTGSVQIMSVTKAKRSK